jgi:serine/threonine protein kinase
MNNYSLTEEIGRGKYSVVYKGRKKKTIQYFAIKSVEKSHKEKVLNEVATLGFFKMKYEGFNSPPTQSPKCFEIFRLV